MNSTATIARGEPVEITGTHPYADEFPMASEDELTELTNSVATVGLIHPIVVTPDGLVLDGRNRLEACSRAEVEPTLEVRDGSDDEYKEFVIGVNTTGRRESMTVQIAAASTALILGEEKRANGRWRRGTINEDLRLSDSGMKKGMEQAGLVLDTLGRDALAKVRDGETSLNAAYEYALAKRDEEARAAADEANAEREESEAAKDLEANAPEYLDEVGDGLKYANHRIARAVWLETDRKAKRERETREREFRDSLQRDANRVKAFLNGFSASRSIATNCHPHGNDVLELLNSVERRRFLTIKENLSWPTSEI